MLQIKDVTVKFGGLTAVKNMNFEVKKNEIHSLIGPNGAGKTTVFNAITGVVDTAAGDVLLNGKSLISLNTNQMIYQGLARTFQNLQLFRFMSVYENIYAGYVHNYKKSFISVFFKQNASFDQGEAFARVMEVADMMHIRERLGSFPDQLPYGILKRVELARAMASDPQLILFDEPAAGLTNEETKEVIDVIKLLQNKGKTILLVEHDMNLVMKVSDRITVMNFGEKIAEGTPQEVANNPEVIKVYLGSH
ncbi:MAG TPA: ABC transporter ATP-binding protein [Smithellaceae bacterium]|nr:ABC transporter ATP-binding protein [Smithellaceae bacterium]